MKYIIEVSRNDEELYEVEARFFNQAELFGNTALTTYNFVGRACTDEEGEALSSAIFDLNMQVDHVLFERSK